MNECELSNKDLENWQKDDRKLTDEQVENWRKILCMQLGPYALMMPKEDIQKIRDKMQGAAYQMFPAKELVGGYIVEQTGTLVSYVNPTSGNKTMVQLHRLNEILTEKGQTFTTVTLKVTKADRTPGTIMFTIRNEESKKFLDDLDARLDKLGMEAV